MYSMYNGYNIKLKEIILILGTILFESLLVDLIIGIIDSSDFSMGFKAT